MRIEDWQALSEGDQLDLLEDALFDGGNEVICTRPGCDCCCEVEPDARCSHGCESIQLFAGVI